MPSDVMKSLIETFGSMNLTEVLEAVGVKQKRTSAITVLGIFAAGAAVGAAGAMLLAPQSGSDLRAMINDRVQQGVGAIKEKATSLRSKATNLKNQVSEEIPGANSETQRIS